MSFFFKKSSLHFFFSRFTGTISILVTAIMILHRGTNLSHWGFLVANDPDEIPVSISSCALPHLDNDNTFFQEKYNQLLRKSLSKPRFYCCQELTKLIACVSC